ncbi:MAG TPA: hypothetical protein VGK30_18965 [Candidatus Binatia bacterium]
MRVVFVLCFLLGFLAPVHAQTQEFFFHHSAVPVTIPGGTTNFPLDMTVPPDVTPLVDEHILDQNQAQALPPFTSAPFVSDESLLPIASVRLNLSANQKMRHCARVTTQLFKIDGTSALTPIGAASVLNGDVSQAKAGGTLGFTPTRIEFQLSNNTIPTGNGIVLNTAVENDCKINRHIFFAYDSLSAPSSLRFQCCFSVQAKCAAAKIKAVGKKASCLLALDSEVADKGVAADPTKVQKCKDGLVTAFDKLEAKGNCITSGDASSIEAAIDGFTADVDAALNAAGPPSSNKCQAAKIKAAAAKTSCLLGLKAKAAATGNILEPLDPAKVAKCLAKYATAFSKLEDKGGCVTSGDAAAIEGKIDTFVDGTTSALACPCPS